MSSNPIYALPTEPASPVAGEAQDVLDRTWLDRVGIGASVACAIHCMAAPFLMLLLPAAGATWSHPAVHWVLAVLVLPLAVWVIYRGYLKHRKRWTLYAAAAGSACIVAGLIMPMIFSKPVFTIKVPALTAVAPKVMLASINGPLSTELKADQPIDNSSVLIDPVAVATKPARACDDPDCCPSTKSQASKAVATGTQAPASVNTAAVEPDNAEQPAVCTDPACCPSLTEDTVAGGYKLAVPPGGLITLIGSLLLVFAHTSNLVACRCYTKSAKVSGAPCGTDCGCPSA